MSDFDDSAPRTVREPSYLSNPGALAIAVSGLLLLAAVFALVVVLALGEFG